MWSTAGATWSQPGCCRRRTHRRPSIGNIVQQSMDTDPLRRLVQEQEQEHELEQEQEQDRFVWRGFNDLHRAGVSSLHGPRGHAGGPDSSSGSGNA
eukprot:4829382-Alexandrium_andersonii.AAC.1